MAYVIFSKRQHTSPSETIPKNLRVQIFYIWGKVWGTSYYNNFNELRMSRLAYDAYKSIEATLGEQYGVLSLDGGDGPDEDRYGFYWAVRKLLLETEDTDKVIDVIEVSFRYIDQEVRGKFRVSAADVLDKALRTNYRDIPPDSIPPDAAIDLLNQRFRGHNVGYQYESGQIVKVDSPDSHSEVVKPAEELPNNTQQTTDNDTVSNENKKIFIGHGRSPVWRELKDFIVETLGLEYEEFDRISAAGKSINNRLEEMLDKSCMAFLIMTGEDEHSDGSPHARQNVIHEIGKCQEKFGSEQAIILLEKGCGKFSNMDGIIYIDFAKGNIKETFGEIVRVLIRESVIRIELCN